MSDLQQRRELLEAVLGHVVFDGWSRSSLRAACEDMGLGEADLDQHFPGGPRDAIRFFSDEADLAMLAGLEKQDLGAMKIRDRVAAAVRLRLGAIAPYREAARRGLGFLSLPGNAPLGIACLYRTVDAIWHGIGDRSTDYNFYSKRLLLAGVYSSTLVYWLNDDSEDFAASWAFLERRIGEVLKVGGTFGKTVGRLLDLPDRLMRARPGRGFGPSPLKR